MEIAIVVLTRGYKNINNYNRLISRNINIYNKIISKDKSNKYKMIYNRPIGMIVFRHKECFIFI